MKILTNDQYNVLIDSVKLTAYADGKQDGYLKGYKEGHHKGMIADKEGAYICSGGIYLFKCGVSTVAVTDPAKQEEISAYFK